MIDLTPQQATVVELLVRLIGLSGVHRRPEQDDSIVLDLLPGDHVMGGPFCIRVRPDGNIDFVSDEEAGLSERPHPLKALRMMFEESDRRSDILRGMTPAEGQEQAPNA